MSSFVSNAGTGVPQVVKANATPIATTDATTGILLFFSEKFLSNLLTIDIINPFLVQDKPI